MAQSISRQEFKKEIIAFFEQEMTIAEAKKKITEMMKKDEFDNKISVSNVRVMYTANKNFCGGVKNGYGPGWYITNAGKEYIRI